MDQHTPDDDELGRFASALSALAPRESRIDRDRLMFLAGQQSAAVPRTGRRWLWPAATAVSTVAAVVLAVLLALRPEPAVVQIVRNVYVDRSAPPAAETAPAKPLPDSPAIIAEAPAPPRRSPVEPWRPLRESAADLPSFDADRPAGYLALRQRVLAYGVDALSPPAPSPALASALQSRPETYGQLREEYLPRPDAETIRSSPPLSEIRRLLLMGETL